MKSFRISAALAILLSVIPATADSVPPPPPTTSVETAVEARSRAWIKTAMDRDIVAFRSFASDDYVLMWVEPAKDGQKARWATRTRDEWAELLRSGSIKYQSIELRNTKVHVHGDVAIFAGEYSETVTSKGRQYTDEGLFNETWVRRHDQWIIIGSTFP
jgi:ketosteroid isomerase-like protein